MAPQYGRDVNTGEVYRVEKANMGGGCFTGIGILGLGLLIGLCLLGQALSNLATYHQFTTDTSAAQATATGFVPTPTPPPLTIATVKTKILTYYNKYSMYSGLTAITKIQSLRQISKSDNSVDYCVVYDYAFVQKDTTGLPGTDHRIFTLEYQNPDWQVTEMGSSGDC